MHGSQQICISGFFCLNAFIYIEQRRFNFGADNNDVFSKIKSLTLGLLHLHAKKVEFVLQEIFAKLTMYNFCELITQSVVIQQAQKKYDYKVNFSDAVHICRQFFLGDIPPPIVEALLMKYISPIRPGRKDTRKLTQKPSVSFTYRVA